MIFHCLARFISSLASVPTPVSHRLRRGRLASRAHEPLPPGRLPSELVPYGYLGKLAYLQKRYELSFPVTDRTVVPELPEPVKLGRGLYQYQAAAVEAVTSRRCGSLVAPMGAGNVYSSPRRAAGQ